MVDNKIIEEIVQTAHHLYNKNMTIAKAGNISIRDKNDENHIYITASGTNFKQLTYKDVLRVNINTMEYDKTDNLIPSMETELHIGVYKNREDINSVVHVHSPYATAFAFSKRRLCQQEGFGPITGEYITEVSYYPPGSKKLAVHTADALKNEDAVLLKNHGVICVGEDIKEATLLCEYIEEIAKTQYVTHVLNL